MAIDLDALERLALEATPGKWSVRPASNGGLILLRPCVQEYLQVLPEEDARHIAATNPDTILDLVRELRAARAVINEARCDYQDGHKAGLEAAAKECQKVKAMPEGGGNDFASGWISAAESCESLIRAINKQGGQS